MNDNLDLTEAFGFESAVATDSISVSGEELSKFEVIDFPVA